MNKGLKSSFGVYYNTLDSEDYYFIFEDLKIYFSSMYNLTRFKERLSHYIYEENQKIINKYKIRIDLTLYLILSLYKSIEKRGYKILRIGSNDNLVEKEFKLETIIKLIKG